MPRTRIKICGITNWPDAETAIGAGADALGFMMYDRSARFVAPDTVRDIQGRLPPFVTCVGVFVNSSREQIADLCGRLRFDVLQFHGDESHEFCSSFDLPFVKAVRVSRDVDLDGMVDDFPDAAAILLDSQVEDAYGGSGQVFDWRLASGAVQKPVILAGGLNPSNVAKAIKVVRPFAVDVSSGVEREKGIKDPDKIHEFVAAVNLSDKQSDEA